MLPGAELTKDAVVSHLRIVWRKREEAAARHRDLLRQVRIHPDGVKLAEEGIEHVHAGAEGDLRFRVLPGEHDIIRSHPIRNVVTPECRRGCQALRHAAVRRHDIDFGVAIVSRRERELRSIC